MIISDSPSFIIKSSDKIKTKPEYAKYAYDLHPLKKDEYDSLKADIAANGRIYTPLSINKEGIILDGHHRFKIGLEVGIKEFPVMVQEFEDPLDELAFVIKINVLCRQLNDFQKAELGHELEKIEAERAKKRQIANLKIGKQVPLASNEANGEEGKTAEKVAKKIGVSTATYERAKKIIQKAPEDLKQKIRSGKTSITSAYKSVMGATDHKAENVPKLPQTKNKAITNDGDRILSIEEENLETSPAIDSPTIIDGNVGKASSCEQDLTEQDNHGIKECSGCKELYSENVELKEALAKSSQLTTADKAIPASSLSTTPQSSTASSTGYNHSTVAAVDDTLAFEFSLSFEDIRKYMAALYEKKGDSGKIWFSGEIDTKTRRVISANLGRIEQQHQQGKECTDIGDL